MHDTGGGGGGHNNSLAMFIPKSSKEKILNGIGDFFSFVKQKTRFLCKKMTIIFAHYSGFAIFA